MRFLSPSVHLLLLALAALPTSVFAEGSSKGARPCFTSDLIGTWEMTHINSKVKIDPNDSFGWPYQMFAFDRRGDVKQMTSTTPIDQNQKLLEKFNNSASTSKFSVDLQGGLNITKIESPQPEHCTCSYVTKEAPAEVLARLPDSKRSQMHHQGDIMLTYKSKNGQPIVIKSLKKVR